MKNVIKNFWATSYIEYKAIENNKQIIYTQLMVPILYFVFFGFGIGNSFSSLAFKGENVSYIEYIFVGIIGVILNSQMNQSVYRVNLDKKWGLLAYKRIKGTSAISYFLGKLVFPLGITIVQVLLIYFLSFFLGIKIQIVPFLKVLIIVIISLVFWFSLGVIISLGTVSYRTRDLILGTLLLPIIFAAPTFYSLDNSKVLYYISKLNPLTYQLTSMRTVIFGMDFDINTYVTIFLSLIMFVLAISVIIRSELLGDERQKNVLLGFSYCYYYIFILK